MRYSPYIVIIVISYIVVVLDVIILLIITELYYNLAMDVFILLFFFSNINSITKYKCLRITIALFFTKSMELVEVLENKDDHIFQSIASIIVNGLTSR